MDQKKDYMTLKEAVLLKGLLTKNLSNYKNKPSDMTDLDWLKSIFKLEFPSISEDELNQKAEEIIKEIQNFDTNLKSINDSAKIGISKEQWLADKLQEVSVGMSINEYGATLQKIDDMLYRKNIELSDALTKTSDGSIKMSPNLDGNIAENMIANTAELSGFLQGKNIKVEVLENFTKNSVDVRATDCQSGKFQNYQLKFGKDAKATIKLIERGNYNNQRIIVPAEQLNEIQEYFKSKGSNKTISDCIEISGVKGKQFTKKQVKDLQLALQEDNIMPKMDYSHYQTKDLAVSIGKNASALAMQSIAVTTGLNIAQKIFNGEQVNADELVEISLKTGADTSIKVITAGTLEVAIRKGIISVIPQTTPAGIIANIACVGIENIKILTKIATGEIPITKGLDHICRVTTSMLGGLSSIAKGAELGAKITALIPVLGAPLAVVGGVIGGTIGYLCGSKVGDAIYQTGKKISNIAKNVGKTMINGLKSVGTAISSGVKSFCRGIGSLLGF